MKTFNAEAKTTDLNDTDLELVSGGAHSLGDTLHRLWFAASCVLSGQTLTVKGDQLQCHG
jgi:hypothetical protein